MKRKFRTILSLTLCLMMLLGNFAIGGEGFSKVMGVISVKASAANSGKCGENVYYSFDSLTGTMTISGSGEMTDYGYADSPFCCDYSIISIVVKNGVTNISHAAFLKCKNLVRVTIGPSVESIDMDAFQFCESLNSIFIPNSVIKIGYDAFSNCKSLKSVYYEGSSKSNINISTSNAWLINANWYYNEPMPDNIIKGNTASKSKTYEYKTAVTFYANVPEDGSVQWYVDDKPTGSNESLAVPTATKSYTVKVVVTDKNGKKTADTEKVTIKNSFFDKFAYFFKHLFNPSAYIVNQQ